MTVSFVPLAPEHRVFVISSWLDSFRDSHFAGQVAMEDWYTVMWPQVEKVIDRQNCTTMVAVNGDDHSQTFGFIAADITTDPPIVFYVLVKQPHRRWRYARGLFDAVGINPAAPFDYAYKTSAVPMLSAKIPLARWQPMWARFPEGRGIRR